MASKISVHEPNKSSSPRAESASAVTGRLCPHSGEGKDFLTHQPGFFFYKNGCSSGTESRKWLLRWEMNDLSKGYKQSVDQNWGRVVKIGFFRPKNEILGPKKNILFFPLTMFRPRPEKFVPRKSLLSNFG